MFLAVNESYIGEYREPNAKQSNHLSVASIKYQNRFILLLFIVLDTLWRHWTMFQIQCRSPLKRISKTTSVRSIFKLLKKPYNIFKNLEPSMYESADTKHTYSTSHAIIVHMYLNEICAIIIACEYKKTLR